MKTRNQKTSDAGIDHNAEITSDNVTLNVSAAILAGGRARRLDGTYKPSLIVGEDSILTRLLAAFRDAGVEDIVIVGNRAPSCEGARHAPDVIDGGPLGGLYSALLMATRPVVVVMAGDMPFVTGTLVRSLARMADHEEAVVPRTNGRWHPLCAAYRRSIALRVKQRLDREAFRVTSLLDELCVRELSPDVLAHSEAMDMLLMNVNTPDDYREAERLARAR